MRPPCVWRAAHASWTARASSACCCSARPVDRRSSSAPRAWTRSRQSSPWWRWSPRDSGSHDVLMLTGVAVAPGEAIGPAVVVRLRAHDVRYRIASEDVASEQDRLAAASDRTRYQLEDIRGRTRHVLGAE